MHTAYRAQLESHIDRVAYGERTGWKPQTSKKTSGMETVKAIAFTVLLLACVLLASYGDTISGINPAV